MQGYLILKKCFDRIIETGLTSKVYHSVVKFADDNSADGETYPMYPSGGDDYEYVGIDDTKQMTVYCRQLGDLKVVKPEPVGSSQLSYKCSLSYRMVFFNDWEQRNQYDLLKQFIKFVFIEHVRLVRMITDKDKLKIEESKPKGFNFGNQTFYAAIDFDILLTLRLDNCETEITCCQLPNPYTQ